MLKSHFDAVENSLLATSQIAANTGHSLHKGTPRETFMKQFLESHLSSRVGICTGEIVSCDSIAGEPRNQIDLILYKSEYPRLFIGGDIYAVLAESVIATIEVKSTLTEAELEKAVRTANAIKQLKRNVITAFTSGYHPPSVLSFVVAYDGPASMQTVGGWLRKIHIRLAIAIPSMPPSLNDRAKIASPSIDGVFILGKGFLVFDNTVLTFASDNERSANPRLTWIGSDAPRGSLQYLFLILTQGVSGVSASWLNPGPYLSTFQVPNRVLIPE